MVEVVAREGAGPEMRAIAEGEAGPGILVHEEPEPGQGLGAPSACLLRGTSRLTVPADAGSTTRS